MIQKISLLTILTFVTLPTQADFWNVTSLGPISATQLADQGYNCTWGYTEKGWKFTWNALDTYFRCLKPDDSIILCGNGRSKGMYDECKYEDGPDFIYKGNQLTAGVFDRKLIGTSNGHQIFSPVIMYKPSKQPDEKRTPTVRNPVKPASPPPYVPSTSTQSSTPYHPPGPYQTPPVATPVSSSTATPEGKPKITMRWADSPSSPKNRGGWGYSWDAETHQWMRMLPLDVDRYCRDNFSGDSRAVLEAGGAVSNWRCELSDGQHKEIDFRDACKQQYDTEKTGVIDKNDPSSLHCLKPK